MPADALRIVPLAISVVVVLLLFRYVPAKSVSFGDRLAGALVSGLLLFALSLASSFIYDRTTALSLVFGSLTTLFFFLYSVYLYACALLSARRWPPRGRDRCPTPTSRCMSL